MGECLQEWNWAKECYSKTTSDLHLHFPGVLLFIPNTLCFAGITEAYLNFMKFKYFDTNYCLPKLVYSNSTSFHLCLLIEVAFISFLFIYDLNEQWKDWIDPERNNLFFKDVPYVQKMQYLWEVQIVWIISHYFMRLNVKISALPVKLIGFSGLISVLKKLFFPFWMWRHTP
jgi:hypothetical protein